MPVAVAPPARSWHPAARTTRTAGTDPREGAARRGTTPDRSRRRVVVNRDVAFSSRRNSVRDRADLADPFAELRRERSASPLGVPAAGPRPHRDRGLPCLSSPPSAAPDVKDAGSAPPSARCPQSRWPGRSESDRRSIRRAGERVARPVRLLPCGPAVAGSYVVPIGGHRHGGVDARRSHATPFTVASDSCPSNRATPRTGHPPARVAPLSA